MSTLEWWYDLDPGFLAHTALLGDTFSTAVDGRGVTVHPPAVPDGAVRWANEPLGPPRIPGYTPSSPPGPEWGWLDSFTDPGEEIVAVRRLVLTSEVDTDIETVQEIADRMIKATARWWASVSSWIEIVTRATSNSRWPSCPAGHR